MFDQPLRELGFHGVPHKASVFIVPTLTCMVELIETPFLEVSLIEIVIVNLERVGLGQKNFDMAIVFKDFNRDVIRIDSIPSTSLDDIKKWLNIAEIKYYESRLNMKWQAILKTIKDDPQQFIDEGGWEFLNLEGGDSDSEGSEESDQVYAPSDIETDSEDDDSGSASDESEAEDDDDDSGGESKDEDEEEEERSEEKSRAGHGSSARKRPKLM